MSRLPKFAVFVLFLFVPCLASFAQTSGIANGANAGEPINGEFSGGSVDSVQLNNGNLHVDIPILDLPGVGIPIQIHFIHDSKIWNYNIGPEPAYFSEQNKVTNHVPFSPTNLLQ